MKHANELSTNKLSTNNPSLNKFAVLFLAIVFLSGCRVETHSDDIVLKLYFSPSAHEHWSWAASTYMLFDYYGIYYSQADIVDYQYHYFDYHDASIYDLSWILWDLGGIDTVITGTLSFSELRQEINAGRPVVLHYGDYYNGHYMVVHGYDHRGRVYLHDPHYGTRIVDFDSLYYRYFHGVGHYWESSLLLLN